MKLQEAPSAFAERHPFLGGVIIALVFVSFFGIFAQIQLTAQKQAEAETEVPQVQDIAFVLHFSQLNGQLLRCGDVGSLKIHVHGWDVKYYTEYATYYEKGSIVYVRVKDGKWPEALLYLGIDPADCGPRSPQPPKGELQKWDSGTTSNPPTLL